METFQLFDKSAWPAGPWQSEPDEARWVDEISGYPCRIRRTPHGGSWCGYVQVPAEHPLAGMHYSDKIERLSSDVELHEHFGAIPLMIAALDHEEGRIAIDVALKVHGGVTFSGELLGETGWWFGFDCGHANDLTLIPQWNDPRMGSMLRSIYAGQTYRTFEYVIEECQSLAEQLLHLA